MRISVVEGDGIGKEVIPVARKALELLRPDIEFFPVEAGYGRWQRTGTAIGDEDISALRSADFILFGAVTTPPDPDYRSVIVRIRKELDLYANIRPVKGDDVDLVIVRENTEGLYSGIETVEEDRACTLRCITRKGSERIARYASRLAASRRDLTIGHKANVLKSDVLFRDICIAEAQAAGVSCNDKYIDALALDILQHPAAYDVIVTTNIFGDILSDVASYLIGGLGLVASANIGDRYALFEPVHGSAPDIAGKNIANPIATILSAAMMFEYAFKLMDEGKLIRDAVTASMAAGIVTEDISEGQPYRTSDVGDWIADYIAKV